MGRKWLLAAAAFLLWGGAVPCQAEVVSLNIPRMIQECPGFSDHPESQGILWLGDFQYSMGAGGALERLSTRIVLGRKGISDRWTRWNVPIPEGGRVEVRTAALYDPGTGRLLAPVLPRKAGTEGAGYMEILFPDLQEEFIIVLSLREVFPKRFDAGDFLWLQEDLPAWEQRVAVELPAGSELAFVSRGAEDPKKMKRGAVDRYEWTVLNAPSWKGRNLKRDSRSCLAFSMKKGDGPLARYISGLESVPLPQPPAGIRSVMGTGDSLRKGYALLESVAASPSLIGGLSEEFVRKEIPAEGPWTSWEKVLLLGRWIRQAGWESRVHWVTAFPVDDGSPAPEGMILRPVLELSYPGIVPFFHDLGQSAVQGENSPSLWGTRVYSLSGSGLSGQIVSGSSASDHRLSMEWTLAIDPSGVVAGRLDVFVRNGWNGFFFPGGAPDEPSLKSLFEDLFPGMVFSPGTETIRKIKYGYQITLPVESRRAIVSQGAMLVPFPSASPRWLAGIGTGGKFRTIFPFVMEQQFTLKLLPKSDILMEPSPVNRSLDKTRYEESVFYNRRKNTFTGGSKIVLSTDSVTESVGTGLAEAVKRWEAYFSKTLPLRIKN